MAKYAHVENNQISGVYDTLPVNWRNISNLPSLENDTEFLFSMGWQTIQKINPTYNTETQRLGEASYAILDGQVVENIEVIDIPTATPVAALSAEEIALILESHHNDAIARLREKRDLLLQETDFSQLVDVIAINSETITLAYQTYRQELRGLPTLYESDPSFVDESTVIYPTLNKGQ
jgi:hypothetical protein